jgi:transcriptional antiterminator NusG
MQDAPMKNQWFVIHTLSGQEQKVKDTLEKRLKIEEMEEYILEILVPMEKVVEIRNGKKTVQQGNSIQVTFSST